MEENTKSVYRSIGTGEKKERIGAGRISKAGHTVDFENRREKSYVIVYIVRGSGKYVDPKQKVHELKAGYFFQRFPGMPHSNYIDPESKWLEYFIEIDNVMFNALKQAGLINEKIPVYDIGLNYDLCQKISNLINELHSVDENLLPVSYMNIVAVIKDFFKLAITSSVQDENGIMVQNACKILTEDYSQKISIKSLCRKNGWGFEKFRKVFQAKIGISPNRYRIIRRIDTACQMLRDSHKNISEISSELGYTSPYEFSAQFKKYAGVPPSGYIKGKNVNR